VTSVLDPAIAAFEGEQLIKPQCRKPLARLRTCPDLEPIAGPDVVDDVELERRQIVIRDISVSPAAVGADARTGFACSNR